VKEIKFMSITDATAKIFPTKPIQEEIPIYAMFNLGWQLEDPLTKHDNALTHSLPVGFRYVVL
jgi:hypothetical protein